MSTYPPLLQVTDEELEDASTRSHVTVLPATRGKKLRQGACYI